MRAAVLFQPGELRVIDVPDAVLVDPRDAIVRVTLTAIGGFDLHYYTGALNVPQPLVLGREFVGIVEELGAGVSNLSRGDRVVVSSPVSCGQCWFCTHQLPTQCERSLAGRAPDGIFGFFGSAYPGGQAEYVRVPFADFGARRVPSAVTDEQALFLGDVLPAALAAVDWACVGTGDTVAVFGCGAVGLIAQKLAWVRGAARVIGVDVLPYRLDAARRLTRAETLNAAEEDAVARMRDLTNGRGADVCIDAIGLSMDRMRGQTQAPTSLGMALSALRPGGRLSGIGACKIGDCDLSAGELFAKAISVRLGYAPSQELIDGLIELVQSGRVVPDDVITHRVFLGDIERGYRLCADKREACIKVVVRPDAPPQ